MIFFKYKTQPQVVFQPIHQWLSADLSDFRNLAEPNGFADSITIDVVLHMKTDAFLSSLK